MNEFKRPAGGGSSPALAKPALFLASRTSAVASERPAGGGEARPRWRKPALFLASRTSAVASAAATRRVGRPGRVSKLMRKLPCLYLDQLHSPVITHNCIRPLVSLDQP